MPVIGCTLVIWLCRGISDSVLSDELEEAEDTTGIELAEELERSLAGELDAASSKDEPPPQANNDKIHTVPINLVIVECMLIPVIKSCSRLSYVQWFKFRLLLL